MIISRTGIVLDKWGIDPMKYSMYLRCECNVGKGGSIFDVSHVIKNFDVQSASRFSLYNYNDDTSPNSKRYIELLNAATTSSTTLKVASPGKVITIELYIYYTNCNF